MSEEPEFSFRSKLAVVAVVAVVVVASVAVVAAVRCPLRSSGGEGQRMAAGLQPTGMWPLDLSSTAPEEPLETILVSMSSTFFCLHFTFKSSFTAKF